MFSHESTRWSQTSLSGAMLEPGSFADWATPVPVVGGWIQVNNSVVPYIIRNEQHFMPLRVIQNAANMFKNVHDFSLPVAYLDSNECCYLNELCASVGLNYSVDSSAPMIRLIDVVSLSKRPPFIGALPSNDPFGCAQLVEVEEEMMDSRAVQTRGPPAGHGPPAYNEVLNLLRCESTAKADLSISPVSSSYTATHVQSIPGLPGLHAPLQKTVPQPAEFTLTTLSFKDRTISAFYQNDRYYVLLEAVNRVFFPEQSVTAFVDGVQRWLRLPVAFLTPAQERFFIEFYRLPTNVLNCRKIMFFDDFTENYWRLEKLFASRYSQTIDVPQSVDITGSGFTTYYDVSRTRPVNVDSAAVSNQPAAGTSETRRAKRVKTRVFSEVIEID